MRSPGEDQVEHLYLKGTGKTVFWIHIFYSICQPSEMNRGGLGIGNKDRWALNCFECCISILVKTRFGRQVQFLIPQELGCDLNE